MEALRLELEVGGFRVLIEAEAECASAIASLKEDFGYFEVSSANGASKANIISVRLLARPFQGAVPKPRLFRTRMCVAYGWGRRRYCDYGQGSSVLSLSENGGRAFFVHSPEPLLLYEIAYSCLLSAIGEQLDRAGIHRLHALGFSVGAHGAPGGLGVVISAPSGVGKSALGVLLLRETNASMLSDESVLLIGHQAWPFPVRQALRFHVAQALSLSPKRVFERKHFDKKYLFPIPPDRVAMGPVPVSRLMLARRVSGQTPEIRPISRIRLFIALLPQMILGLGNAQMAEYMLRLDQLPRLAWIAASRLRTLLRLCLRAQGFEFRVTEDAYENFRVLKRWLGA